MGGVSPGFSLPFVREQYVNSLLYGDYLVSNSKKIKRENSHFWFFFGTSPCVSCRCQVSRPVVGRSPCRIHLAGRIQKLKLFFFVVVVVFEFNSTKKLLGTSFSPQNRKVGTLCVRCVCLCVCVSGVCVCFYFYDEIVSSRALGGFKKKK